MVSAWPEPPSDTSAAKSVGVRDGMEALASAGTETHPPLGRNFTRWYTR